MIVLTWLGIRSRTRDSSPAQLCPRSPARRTARVPPRVHRITRLLSPLRRIALPSSLGSRLAIFSSLWSRTALLSSLRSCIAFLSSPWWRIAFLSSLRSRIAFSSSLRSRVARVAFVIGTGLALAGWLALPDPLIDTAEFVHPVDSVVVLDRHGDPLRYARSGDADRRWVPLEEISPELIDAVIAIEDARFRSHDGVDVRATGRAILDNVLPGRRRSGASTITQQLVKLVYGREHGLWSKPFEIARAIALEDRLSKDEILEQYLNRLPYGNGIVGVERASEAYFGHPASSLTLSEAALLAGIPQAPSATEPRRHLPRAMRRRARVLARIRELGVRSAAEVEAAEREPIAIVTDPPRTWAAPRFVDRVLRARREGALIARGGRLTTSLDRPLQERAERIVAARASELSHRGVENGAAIVVANSTGEILAYVGAARREGAGADLDLLRARRQPGSTLKPFVYELLFERGATAASILDDVAVPMTGRGGVLYAPRDYDGAERGPIRARLALAGSLNLAALDAARRVGPDRIVERLEALGFTGVPPVDRVGAAVVLGGVDVQPIELAEAYVALSRGGTRVSLRSVPGVIAEGREVMSVEGAEIARDVLFDARARALAFGSDLRAQAGGREFGLKTGTSTGFRDAWAIAFDDRFTVLVWLGDPRGGATDGVSGFEGAAPVAARILDAAHERLPSLGAAIAADVRARVPLLRVEVCGHTGLLPGARCRHLVEERFVEGTVPAQRCDAHAEHGALLLPSRYAEWIARAHPAATRLRGEAQPAVLAAPVIVQPRDGARILLDPSRAVPELPLNASLAGVPFRDVTWEIDGRATSSARWRPTRGSHTLIAIHAAFRSAPVTITIE